MRTRFYCLNCSCAVPLSKHRHLFDLRCMPQPTIVLKINMLLHMCVCMYVRTYVCMYVCVCMYVRTYVRMYICVCVCVYVSVSVCVCICIYIYIV